MVDLPARPTSPPPSWRLSDAALALGLLLLGYVLLLGALIGGAVAFGVSTRDDPAGALLTALVTLLLEAWIGGVVWGLARRRGLTGVDLGLDRPPDVRRVAYAVGGAYGALVAYGLLLAAIERVAGADLGALKEGNGLPDLPGDSNLVWLILGVSVVACAPLSEELFFRGLLFRAVAGRFGLAAGVAGSALLFSAFHLNVSVVLPFLVIGLILAWAYHASGSLWTSVVAHAIVNTVSFVLTLAGVGP